MSSFCNWQYRGGATTPSTFANLSCGVVSDVFFLTWARESESAAGAVLCGGCAEVTIREDNFSDSGTSQISG